MDRDARTLAENKVAGHEDEVVWHDIVLRRHMVNIDPVVLDM